MPGAAFAAGQSEPGSLAEDGRKGMSLAMLAAWIGNSGKKGKQIACGASFPAAFPCTKS
jgi:hypothetical protein